MSHTIIFRSKTFRERFTRSMPTYSEPEIYVNTIDTAYPLNEKMHKLNPAGIGHHEFDENFDIINQGEYNYPIYINNKARYINYKNRFFNKKVF